MFYLYLWSGSLQSLLLVSVFALVEFVVFNASSDNCECLFRRCNSAAVTPDSVERYDPSKDAWEMVAPMADKRINFGVGVMLGFIFVVGGHNGVSHLSSIERYDPHQNQWTICRPMNEPRTGEFLRKDGKLKRRAATSGWLQILPQGSTTFCLMGTGSYKGQPVCSTLAK